MEQLFTPWRYSYITANPTDSECFFCAAARLPDDPEGLVVHTARHHLVMLNLHPYSNGHLMAAPYRHVARPGDLDAGERAELWALLDRAIGVLTDVMAPHGFNAGLNLGRVAGAGVEDHLHLHVVPRWNGDTNFMPVLADVKVLPEHLLESRRKLAAAWG